MKIPTLLYHHINDSFENNITITAQAFRGQMALLQTLDYRVISVEQAIKCLCGSISLPRKSVLITFDDGYEDFYTAAFPILQSFNYPATVFSIIEATGHWNEWNRRAPYVANHLSWPQIIELSRHNISFGCHTLSHHSLVRFDEARIRRELGLAQLILAEKLGRPITALSYPYGDFDRRTQAIAAELFELAFSVDCGTWDWRTGRFAIRRIKIGPATTLSHLQTVLQQFENDTLPASSPGTPPLIPDIKT